MKQQVFNTRQGLRRALRSLGLTSTEAILRKWENDPEFPKFREGKIKSYNLLEVLKYAVGDTNAEIIHNQYLEETND